MLTHAGSKTNWLAITILVFGVLVFLTVILWLIRISGVNESLQVLWLYVSIPVGVVNVSMGAWSKRQIKKAGASQSPRLANFNLVVGILDILLGLTPWVILLFFFRWISP